MATLTTRTWLARHELSLLEELLVEDQGFDDLADLIEASKSSELEQIVAANPSVKRGHRMKLVRLLSAERTKSSTSDGVSSSDLPKATELPPSKKWAYFLSHKKSHTRFGANSAELARAFKDVFKYKAGLEGFFDAVIVAVLHVSPIIDRFVATGQSHQNQYGCVERRHRGFMLCGSCAQR